MLRLCESTHKTTKKTKLICKQIVIANYVLYGTDNILFTSMATLPCYFPVVNESFHVNFVLICHPPVLTMKIGEKFMHLVDEKSSLAIKLYHLIK